MTLVRAALLATVLVGCGDSGGFPDAAIPQDAPPGGTLSLNWSLVKMADGTPVPCDQIGGVTVTLILRNRAMQGGFTEIFSCGTGMGTTALVPIGTYDIKFELTGVSGLISTAPEQMGLVVSKNEDTPLSPITFSVDATGGLDLRIDALKAQGNCDTVASGGAGITSMSITLNHVTGGACEPATLMIGASPYTINCAAPVSTACIEKTTAVTVAIIPSDNYQIHIRANQNALFCFRNDDSIRVPPNGMSLMRTLNLASTGTAGCL